MASRKQLWHPDDVKAKIQASQLINRLTKHALSDAPIMDASQVAAATKLLNKVIPDARPDQPGDSPDKPIYNVHKIERVIVDPQN